MSMENTAEPKQLSIRISWDLRQQLQQAANEQSRSLNAEIIRRLQYSIEMDGSNMPRDKMGFHEQSAGFYFNQPETSNQMIETLERISQELSKNSQKLDYISSENFSTRLFKTAIQYLSRKL